MKISETLANFALNLALTTGKVLGMKRCVELSDHSIELSLEKPDKDNRAWDNNLYRNGNVFVNGYSNPIKPRVRYNPELENPDEIDLIEGQPDNPEDIEEIENESPHIELISSSRYRDYMRQDLISQLLTPQEQWKMLAYAVGALAILMLINVLISMSAAGAF